MFSLSPKVVALILAGLALLGVIVLLAVGTFACEAPLRLAPSGEAEIAYHVLGEGAPGTPLLLVNGGPGFAHDYLHLTDVWARFAATRPVIFFDQRGTGGSTPVGRGDRITADMILDDVEALRVALGSPRLAVLGHSWGGWVAMAYALRHPEGVERLVLVGSADPHYAKTEFLMEQLFPDSLARGAKWRWGSPRALLTDVKRHLAMSFCSPELREEVVGGIDAMPVNGTQAMLLQMSANAHDLWPELADVAAPALVGTGRFDANIAPRCAWRIHEALPGSRFVVWEKSGHYPFVEQPDAFFAAVEGFLGSRAEGS